MNGEITQRKGRFDSKAAPITKGIQFETKLKAENFGGTLKAIGDSISFNGVKKNLSYSLSRIHHIITIAIKFKISNN